MKGLEFAQIITRIKEFSFPDIDLVVGIGQGGVVPAVLVAYHLGKDVDFIQLNYRDEKNQVRYPKPKLLKKIRLPQNIRRILLVDDVSVSGATLNAAKRLLPGRNVMTFVLKGPAEYVLFPEIQDCVDWPWKRLGKGD